MDIYWLRYLLSIFRTYFCDLFNQLISSLDDLVEKVQNDSISSGTETSSANFISALITILSKITMKSIDEKYYAAFHVIINITKVETLSLEAMQMLVKIG